VKHACWPQDAEIERLQKAGVRTIRTGLSEQSIYFVTQAYRHGIGTIAILYPTNGSRAKSKRRWSDAPLSQADPEAFVKWLKSLLGGWRYWSRSAAPGERCDPRMAAAIAALPLAIEAVPLETLASACTCLRSGPGVLSCCPPLQPRRIAAPHMSGSSQASSLHASGGFPAYYRPTALLVRS
jgi:hypothetical protein